MYRAVIQRFVVFLKRLGWNDLSSVLGTILVEPWQALKAGILELASWKEPFNFYGMNPQVLTEEHLKQRPLLLIHGNYHSQAAWLSLAKTFQSHALGPLYTVNLPSGWITQKDYQLIQHKIEEIQAQYQYQHVDRVKIDLIGHSRGAFLAFRIAWTTPSQRGHRRWQLNESISHVIKMGSALSKREINKLQSVDPHFQDRLYEIVGTQDILEPKPSLLSPQYQKIIKTGHLKMLTSREAHETILQWLK